MATNPLDGLYYDFHVPLALKGVIDQAIGNQPSGRNTDGLVGGASTKREWYSQPRPCTNGTTEVITSNFKQPVAISEVSFDVLRVPCQVEVWYLDRLNNWRQVMDAQRLPISLSVQSSTASDWYSYHSKIYPVVAQAVQIRLRRVIDSMVGTNAYVVGLRNTLLKRTVYDRAQGKLPFEDEQDPMGNVISKSIEDWDAAQAIDSKPFTFWRSAPMPDPQAVVNLYLDTRKYNGSGQYMDALFLDPVYSNQKLNVYYSNDDESSSSRLSPITLSPTSQNNVLNTNWRSGRGRWDTSTFPSGHSRYFFDGRWGPMVKQNMWIGVEWIPDFSAATPPPYNPVLFQALPSPRSDTGDPSWTTDQFYPTVYYNTSAGTIVLKFYDGTTTKSYSATLSPLISADQPLRIVVGWSYGPDKVYISIKDRQGTEVGAYDQTVTNLPPNVSLDGQVGFADFRGTFTAHIVKRDHHDKGGAAFQSSPVVYVDPDPVLPMADGTIPSTTLDHALYAVDWTLQPHGTGGQHETLYTGKRWMPIWRDYITRRGKLFFPQGIEAKYLKLEFTNLTEESYPVYDTGIQVNYQVFPVTVTQTQTTNHPGLLGVVSGLLTVGVDVLTTGFGTVNWLNPQTVAAAINGVFGPVTNPVQIQTGPGYTTGSVPGTAQAPLTDTTRTELSSPYVYRRGDLSSSALAANQIYNAGSAPQDQTLEGSLGLLGDVIGDAFSPLRNFITNPAAGPVQGNDFWLFPGGTLKMPAVVMNGLTALTETVLGRPPTTEVRMRFNTESVHRYETRVVTRDAAVAYFAGVREAQPMITSYLNRQDPVVFKFDNYTTDQGWALTNTRLIQDRSTTTTLANGDVVKVGPLSTNGRIYTIENTDFDLGLGNWTTPSGTWSWDTAPLNGRWYPGTAHATATGRATELWSTVLNSYPDNNLQQGNSLTVSVYVKWTSLTVTNNQAGIQLGLVTYSNNVLVDDTIVLGNISFANWATHANSDGYVALSGTWTVPSGVDDARIRLVVTDKASAGQVYFDSITLTTPQDPAARIYQTFTTVSNFAKLRCKFSDSGTVRGDSMWARLDKYSDWQTYDLADSPDNYPGGKYGKTPATAPAVNADDTAYQFPYQSQQAYVFAKIKEIQAQGGEANTEQYRLSLNQWKAVDDTTLSYYTSFISLNLFNEDGTRKSEGGTWADPGAKWKDPNVAWGSLHGLVTINLKSDRVYDNHRVLHFTRLAGAGECGVKVRQWTNYIPNGLFRICSRWLKPRANNNSITVRLRRVSDGVVIYQEEIRKPPVGYWHEFATSFQRLPDSADQVYTVELVTSGDAEDELYLADLWVEISHVRYFVTLGSDPLKAQDVTDLRYADTAIASCSEPVNEFTVEARIYTPMAVVTGCQIQPTYLK